MRRTPLVLAFAAPLAIAVAARPDEAPGRWWKGNTHTHTLWSDGDADPRQVVAWYRDRDYDFLALTDHNQLQVGERWFPIDAEGRLKPAHVEALRERFDDVDVRDGTLRLATLTELRDRFEEPGAFLLVTGEEVTAHWTRPANGEAEKRNFPVHVNALNMDEYVPPRGAESPGALMRAAVGAIRGFGDDVLAHVNHPNFGWGLTWEELATLDGPSFFEVHNGHRGVRNLGDARHPSTERMWDLALARRLAEPDGALLYGVATDDAHHHHPESSVVSRPGRGWIVVRAESLDADELVRAMRRGDFYASSGVVLEDVRADAERYVVDLAPREGETCVTRFVGTRRGGEPGEVLHATTADPAVYETAGDELYVRAVVVSDRVHPDGFVDGELERAWTQPVHGPGR